MSNKAMENTDRTDSLAEELCAYYTDRLVRHIADVGIGSYYHLPGPYDYTDWEPDYEVSMKIRLMNAIPGYLIKSEKYPQDNDRICIHYSEDNEQDNIIYAVDIAAIEKVMCSLAARYSHQETQNTVTPYKDEKMAFVYRSVNRKMNYIIQKCEESEEYNLKMSFYSY